MRNLRWWPLPLVTVTLLNERPKADRIVVLLPSGDHAKPIRGPIAPYQPGTSDRLFPCPVRSLQNNRARIIVHGGVGPRRVEVGVLVDFVDGRPGEFVAQPQVQRQTRGDVPIVLCTRNRDTRKSAGVYRLESVPPLSAQPSRKDANELPLVKESRPARWCRES